jgi:hypothetical protein
MMQNIQRREWKIVMTFFRKENSEPSLKKLEEEIDSIKEMLKLSDRYKKDDSLGFLRTRLTELEKKLIKINQDISHDPIRHLSEKQIPTLEQELRLSIVAITTKINTIRDKDCKKELLNYIDHSGDLDRTRLGHLQFDVKRRIRTLDSCACFKTKAFTTLSVMGTVLLSIVRPSSIRNISEDFAKPLVSQLQELQPAIDHAVTLSRQYFKAVKELTALQAQPSINPARVASSQP